MGDDDVHLDASQYSQTELLHGVYNHGYQFQVSNLHWLEFHNRFVTLDVLSEPAFQLQPHDSLQPFQLAFTTNLIALNWAHIGPVILQSVLQAGAQVTDGQGAAAVFGAGLDLSTVWIPNLHIQGTVQVNIFEGPDHSLQTQVQIPATTVSGTLYW
ncbi:MAG: hypothetical protein ABI345_12765 [Jatrophihabitans sp.]